MTSPEAIKESILAHASENSTLLARLASTSENPANLQNHLGKLSSLQDELSRQETELGKITEHVEEKFQKHKSFRDSTLRRLLHRATLMGAKFEAKAMKEESEYFTALRTQSKTSERISHLKTNIDEANLDLEPLVEAAKEHDETHARIDELYENLFAGPTPGFPIEDDFETRFYTSRERNESVKGVIRGARRASRVLNQAFTLVKKAKQCLEVAQRTADNNIFFFGDSISWLTECAEFIVHALAAVDQARAIGPSSTAIVALQVRVVELLNAERNLVPEYGSRNSVVSAIEKAQAHFMEVEEKLPELIEMTKEKEKDALEQIKLTARELENSRQALQQNRQGVFEEVAGFGEAAPAYSECCDRADGWCVISPEEDVDELATEEGVDNELPEYHNKESIETREPVATQQTVRG
jgi:hypothetical protein